MNLNGDEKRIRQLFREMSREEEQRTPDFTRVIAAAGSGTNLSQRGTRSFALAWAAVVLIAVLIAVSLAMRHTGTQTQDNGSGQVAEDKRSAEAAPAISATETTVAAVSTPRPGTTPPKRRPTRAGVFSNRVRYPQRSDELAVRMKALSAWQSPTASLLKTPGDEISLPRLGESLLSIKIFSPADFN